MKYILVVITALAFVFAGIAADDKTEVEIKGAFGYFLGEDGSTLKGRTLPDGKISVQAKSAFRNFETCLITLTDEKQIYIY